MVAPLRILSLLLLLSLTRSQEINYSFGRSHLVQDSQDFHNALKNKSQTVVYLDSDVEVRNYYGWVYSNGRNAKRNGSIEVSAYPLRYAREGRPKIDMDGNALHQLMNERTTLITTRMHYLNVHLPSVGELYALEETHVHLENCIVEVFIRERGHTIRSSVKYIRSLMQDPSDLPYSAGNRVTDWWCHRNEGISCPYGAVVFYNATIPWTENYTWHLSHTILKFVHRRDAEVAISDAFRLAIQNMNDYIAIPYSLELNFEVCKSNAIIRNTTIYDPRRSIPPLLVINFQERLYGCIPVVGTPIVRVTDLILRNIFSSDGWPVVFPFVDAPSDVTVVLENVIIEMDTQHAFDSSDLDAMVKLIERRSRPLGLGHGPQNLSVWQPEDCYAHLLEWESCKTRRKCPKEAQCPSGGIFIDDASFMIEEGDGNNDLGIGVLYHLRQSLITVIPPPAGLVNGSDPTGVTEFNASPGDVAVPINEHSSAKHALLVSAFVIIGIMCALLVLCGYTTYKYGLWERWTGSESQTAPLTGELGGKLCIQDGDSTSDTPSHLLAAKHVDTHQTYQRTASHLLGSVTLGPLLGAGSFGKVFKATWNGATVAVKVIVHDGWSYRGTSAQREALLSSNLHHPNIVQTFVQTTREIKHDEHIPTASQPLPVPTVAPPPPPIPAAGGYMNLAEMVPNEYRAEAPVRSLGSSSELSSGRSFSGDRIETWLIQEYCDMGSLDKAIRKGRYMKGNQLNMVLVVETCVDICRGMHYLQNRNIIHGDLKSCNILLNGSLHESKGFIAKVADFGLSREIGMHASHVSTQTTGTVTHMPPELFKEERLTAASDIYSFGIVMWELVSKESPLEGVPHFLIIKKIVYDNWRPTFVNGIPECYMALARRCWAEDPIQRPTVDLVLEELEAMKQYFQHSDPLL